MVGIPVLLQLVIDRVLADQGGIDIVPLLLLLRLVAGGGRLHQRQ